MRKAGLVFGAVIALVVVLGANAADEKVPDIKKVMKTIAGKDGLCAKCGAAGKAKKWEDAQTLAKSFADCAANLPKNECPKGDPKSWEKLSKQFAEQAKAVSKAADDKDEKAWARCRFRCLPISGRVMIKRPRSRRLRGNWRSSCRQLPR